MSMASYELTVTRIVSWPWPWRQGSSAVPVWRGPCRGAVRPSDCPVGRDTVPPRDEDHEQHEADLDQQQVAVSRGHQLLHVAEDAPGRIDALVDHAGNFHAGSFEENSPEQFRARMENDFFGPLHVTRAVLPVLCAQRSGHILIFTSAARIVG